MKAVLLFLKALQRAEEKVKHQWTIALKCADTVIAKSLDLLKSFTIKEIFLWQPLRSLWIRKLLKQHSAGVFGLLNFSSLSGPHFTRETELKSEYLFFN